MGNPPNCTDTGCYQTVSKHVVDGQTKYSTTNCNDGGAGCNNPCFLSPIAGEDRDFHTDSLRQATQQINEILDREAANAPTGMLLRIAEVPGGLMLTWSEHSDTVEPGSVTPDSPLAERKIAYGLAHAATEAS